MYESLFRQGAGANHPITAAAVAYHRGDRHDFLRRCRKVMEKALPKGGAGVNDIAPYLLGWVADPRTLRCAWDDLAHGGQAPGPNGHRYAELDDHEVWALCRCLGQAIRTGNYRAGEERVRWISKGPGRGDRPLVLQDVEDRVVQRAVVLIAQPLLDPLFDEHSFGFRPGRGRLHALALAEHHTVKGRRTVWVTEDIRDAFSHVPLTRLLQVVKKYLVADDLAVFIGHLVAGASTPGLRQGGPLSPLLLNLYLHHALDRPWRQRHPGTPLIRVADDILLLCRTPKEAKQAHATLTALLTPAGMPTKLGFDKALCRLDAQGCADWLGFRIGRGGLRLVVGVGEKAWQRLQESLARAHEEPDAPGRACAIIRGWVSQMGPCYATADRAAACVRIKALAHAQAFDEIPGRKEINGLWQRAHARWRKLCQQAVPAPTTA